MTDVSKAPERANDVGRPAFDLNTVQNVLDRAPKLTRSWGAFRAFVCILVVLMVMGIIVRPEASPYFGGIFLTAIACALYAAHRKLLD
jgi:hypothetical protein